MFLKFQMKIKIVNFKGKEVVDLFYKRLLLSYLVLEKSCFNLIHKNCNYFSLVIFTAKMPNSLLLNFKFFHF